MGTCPGEGEGGQCRDSSPSLTPWQQGDLTKSAASPNLPPGSEPAALGLAVKASPKSGPVSSCLTPPHLARGRLCSCNVVTLPYALGKSGCEVRASLRGRWNEKQNERQ